MRILGIESSCDETAAAVVEDGETVLSSVVASQMTTHGKYGGVVPELASREHLRAIVPVVREALDASGHRLDDLAAIAVTVGPGLVGSLLVGLTYAKSLSFARGMPLIAVNHIEGHIHAVILEARRAGTPVEFPALALVVSGGHTHLFEVREGFHYRLLGKTRDDAAGEAFDKVAKLLGFGYPGGPVIDRLAPYGDPARGALHLRQDERQRARFQLQRTEDRGAALGGSARHGGRNRSAPRPAARAPQPATEQWLAVTPQAHARSTGFVPARRDHGTADPRRRRGRRHRRAGGDRFRRRGLQFGTAGGRPVRRLPYPVYFPSPGLSTDNAAMIAAAAFPKLERGEFAELDIGGRRPT